MSNTAWLVLGAVAIVGGYLYYQGKVKAGQIEAGASPGTALNTLAAQTPNIINALGDAFGAEHTSIEDGYRGYA